MADKLDKDKPYATIRGTGKVDGHVAVRYMQGGVYFQGDGSPAKKAGDKANPTPRKVEAGAATRKRAADTAKAKARAPKVEVSAEAEAGDSAE